MAVLPKPKSQVETADLNLHRVQAQIAIDMNKIEQVQILSSSFIKEHFEHTPPDQVFVRVDYETLDIRNDPLCN